MFLPLSDVVMVISRLGRAAWCVVSACAALVSLCPAQYFEVQTNTRPTVSYLWSHTRVGDLDNDGRQDLLVATAGPTMVVFLDPAANGILSPSGTVALPTIYGAGARFGLGECNGDGNLDFLASSGVNTVDLFIGQGNGTFSLQPVPISFPAGFAVHDLHVGDLTGDGLSDVVIKVVDSTTVYVNAYVNGGATWTLGWSSIEVYEPVFDRLADFDGDGNLDLFWLVSANAYPAGPPTPPAIQNQLYIARGTGSGGFAQTVGYPIIVPSGFMVGCHVADLDADGRSDVLLTTNTAPDLIKYYGHPTFTLESPVYSTWPTSYGAFFYGVSAIYHVFAFDLNSDGTGDLLRIGAVGVTQFPWWPSSLGSMAFDVLQGTGSRTYSTAVRRDLLLPAPAGAFYTPADYDTDGDIDLLGLPNSWLDAVYLNNTAMYGGKCAGSGGVVPTAGQGTLSLGNAGYYLGVTGAHPLSLAAVGVSSSKASTSGCGVGIDPTPGQLILPLGSFGITSTDLSGNAVLGVPLPNNLGLAGLTVYSQWFIVDAGGALQVGGGYYSASEASTHVLW
jgi:FG-GAP-like repeat